MTQCNRIAECCEAHLKRNGYETKRAPSGQDMNVSIRESNAWGADVHIPIHTNAGGGHGALVMVYKTSPENLKYAGPVYDELHSISPKGGGYGVRIGSDMTGGHWMPAELSSTNGIGVYCECDFHDDPDIAKWIVENVDMIGSAIAKGICKGDGKQYIPDSQPEPEPKPDPKPEPTEIKAGDIVKLVEGAKYTNGRAIPDVIIAEEWIVKDVNGNKALLDKSTDGKWSINSWVYTKYLEKMDTPEPAFQPYIIRTTATVLNIRQGPGTNYPICGQIVGAGVFTIVEEAQGQGSENGWGLLKAYSKYRNGWIALDWVQKI